MQTRLLTFFWGVSHRYNLNSLLATKYKILRIKHDAMEIILYDKYELFESESNKVVLKTNAIGFVCFYSYSVQCWVRVLCFCSMNGEK